MLKFFRSIRQRLIHEKRLRKYLLYAIGEIILVMIGILLALQVNNWNNDRLMQLKEKEYLLEIRENLNRDTEAIKRVFDFNTVKLEAINKMFLSMDRSVTVIERFDNLYSLLPDLTNFDVFTPVRVAFENMISSERIDLISDKVIRRQLSEYYPYNYLEGTQERIKTLTRKFVDDLTPITINKPMIDSFLKIDSEYPMLEEVEFNKNTTIFADLMTMLKVTEAQNKFLEETREKIVKLTKQIDAFLE